MAEEDSLPPTWQKLRVLATVIATVLIPIIIAVAGHVINQSIKQNELELRYVEIAVNILQEKPTSESENLRIWAIDVVNKLAPVKFSKEAESELKKRELTQTDLNLMSLNNYRLMLEKFRTDLESRRNSNEVSDAEYKEGMQKYRKGMDHYLERMKSIGK